MGPDALREMNLLKLDRPYGSQEELVEDILSWLDLLLYDYYDRHQWLGPSSELKNMLGLVVSREEFEHKLGKAEQRGLMKRLSPEKREQLAWTEKVISLRLRRTEPSFPLIRLRKSFCRDDFEWKCVLLAFAPETDRKYEKLFGYLQDDVTRKAPGTDLACELFLEEGESFEARLCSFRRRGGFLRLFDPDALDRGALNLRPEALEFLTAGLISDRPGLRILEGNASPPETALAVGGETAAQLDRLLDLPERCCVLIAGTSGSGKRFQVEQAMRRRGARCVLADLEGEDWRRQAEDAALTAGLTDAYLCLYHLDRRDEAGKPVPPSAAMLEELERLWLGRDKLFLLSETPAHPQLGTLCAELELPPLTEAQRIALFRAALADTSLPDCGPEELGAKFRFTPRQIVAACRQAKGMARLNGSETVSGQLIHRCCYRQAVHRLGELAALVPPGGRWEEVVLPREQLELMRQACRHVRYRHLVYGQWGFERKISYGRGLSILFAGAPGTGKTMCARLIAGELNMEMYKINLSQVVSKYIGETEKNLRAVFEEAKNANSVLFFDECDALFGKRSEVKDSHDRNANMETAYLLQQIEDYDGVCILATNLLGNIDAAFMRRVTYVVHFPFPDAAAREQIFRRLIPPETPLAGDIDWRFLAEKFELSGGHIKNIVLSAAFMAAGEGGVLSMGQLLRSSVNEMKKNGIVVVREQLRQYADLIDDAAEPGGR